MAMPELQRQLDSLGYTMTTDLIVVNFTVTAFRNDREWNDNIVSHFVDFELALKGLMRRP